jgi:hypothetical protein
MASIAAKDDVEDSIETTLMINSFLNIPNPFDN